LLFVAAINEKPLLLAQASSSNIRLLFSFAVPAQPSHSIKSSLTDT
jgi:hypothetical protein